MIIINQRNHFIGINKDNKIETIEIKNIKQNFKFPKTTEFIISKTHLTEKNRMKVEALVAGHKTTWKKITLLDDSMPRNQIKSALNEVKNSTSRKQEIKKVNKTDSAILLKLMKKYNSASLSVEIKNLYINEKSNKMKNKTK